MKHTINKNNKSAIVEKLPFIVLVSLASIMGSVSVGYASNIYFASDEVSYDNSTSGLASTTVQDAIDELCETASEDLVDRLYPVGSIYMSVSLSTASDVDSALGGTWESYGDGRVLRGTTTSAGDTNNDTGTVILTTDNLPSHYHTMSHTHTTPKTTITSSGAHTQSTSESTTAVNNTTNKILTAQKGTTAATGADHTHSVNVRYGGVNSNASDPNKFGLQPGSGYYTGHLTLGANANAGTWASAKQGTTAATGANHTHSVTGTITIPSVSINSSGAHTHEVPAMTTDSQSTTNSGSTGSATPASFSTLDPYITVYIYKRIS